jgi:hypothetical protein
MENKNTEYFALGLIVAAIVYFLFRRQLERTLGVSGGGGNGAGSSKSNGGSSSGGGGGGCSCSGGCASQASVPPSNPGVSLGGQSYNSKTGAFGESSVISVTHPDFFAQTYGS